MLLLFKDHCEMSEQMTANNFFLSFSGDDSSH